MKTAYSDIKPFVTKDGSVIREMMHPGVHGNQQQSLAEATVSAGTETVLHKHIFSEEIYHITNGTGTMTLGEEEFEVRPGDTICIKPGTPHRIKNNDQQPLIILCSCAPAYADEDTVLLDLWE